MRLQLLGKFPANAERADIHEHVPAIPAQQRDGAPAETAVTKGAARKSLNKNVYLIHVCLPVVGIC